MVAEFSKLAKNAYDLLNNRQDTSFFKSKKAIKELFKISMLSYNQLLLARLGLIDDFYSTNINKSNDAIYMLAEDIASLGSDDVVREKFIKFYNDDDDDIRWLFGKKRGWSWRKNMQKMTEGSQSVSLISKYAYFLTDFNFPIYDKLMRNMLYKFGLRDVDISRYVKNVKKLCEFQQVTIDELDACGWLLGKLEEAERHHMTKISLIGNIENYTVFFNDARKFFSNQR